MKKVFSTKRLDPSLMEYAAKNDCMVTAHDVLIHEQIPFLLPDHKPDVLAFTSAVAVKYFFAMPDAKRWASNSKVISLSGATMLALFRYHVKPDLTAENATRLGELAATHFEGELLHVSSANRLSFLADQLKDSSLSYQYLTVYQSIPDPVIMDTDTYAILLFSPSIVRAVVAFNTEKVFPIAVCIGETTAKEAAAYRNFVQIVVSPLPTPSSMLEKLISLPSQFTPIVKE